MTVLKISTALLLSSRSPACVRRYTEKMVPYHNALSSETVVSGLGRAEDFSVWVL